MSSAQERIFVIGGQRCGTTSLIGTLASFPGVSVAQPIRPEPKFFLRSDATTTSALEEYDCLFPDRRDADVLVEKSTTYLESEEAAHRILMAFPEATVVAVLRDPIQRAVSNYRFSVDNGFESRGINEALNPDCPVPPSPAGLSTSPFDYLGRSRYDLLLPVWLRLFERKVLLLSFEEVIAGSAVCRVLGQIRQRSVPLLPTAGRRNASAGSTPELDKSLHRELEDYFRPTRCWMAEHIDANHDFEGVGAP